MNKIDFPLLLTMIARGVIAGVDISGEDLSGQILTGVQIRRSKLSAVRLFDVIGTGIQAQVVTADKLEAQGVSMERARFSDTVLSLADFSGANLKGSYFEFDELEMSGGAIAAPSDPRTATPGTFDVNQEPRGYRAFYLSNFSGADLSGSTFVNCRFQKTDFTGANLSGCRFTNCFMDEVRMDGKTILSGSNYSAVGYFAHKGVPWRTARLSVSGIGDESSRYSQVDRREASGDVRKAFSKMEGFADYRYGADAAFAAVDRLRTMSGFSQKDVYQAMDMPERTYFHKKSSPTTFAKAELYALAAAIHRLNKIEW